MKTSKQRIRHAARYCCHTSYWDSVGVVFIIDGKRAWVSIFRSIFFGGENLSGTCRGLHNISSVTEENTRCVMVYQVGTKMAKIQTITNDELTRGLNCFNIYKPWNWDIAGPKICRIQFNPDNSPYRRTSLGIWKFKINRALSFHKTSILNCFSTAASIKIAYR